MDWQRLHKEGAGLDEDSAEWEEHWHVTGFDPPEGVPPFIGLLDDRPEFRPGRPHYRTGVFAKVVNFDAERLGDTSTTWTVVVTYRQTSEKREVSPLDRPADISLDSESEQVPIFTDANNRPLLSSAGGLITGLTEEQNRWIFNVSKNVPGFPAWLLDYRNAVNIDAVRLAGITIAPGYLLLRNPRIGEEQTETVNGREIKYRQLTFGLVYHPQTWITRFFDRDLYELKEVDVEVPDKNSNEEGATKTVKAIQRVRMTTKNEQGEDVEVDEPQFLDGNGRRPRNPDGSIKAPLDPSDIVILERWTKKRLPFRPLPTT